MPQDTPARAVPDEADASATRVVLFRPEVRVTLRILPGVGAEEATTVAIASWSGALCGTDDEGRPAPAEWWAAELFDHARVASVELAGLSWTAERNG